MKRSQPRHKDMKLRDKETKEKDQGGRLEEKRSELEMSLHQRVVKTCVERQMAAVEKEISLQNSHLNQGNRILQLKSEHTQLKAMIMEQEKTLKALDVKIEEATKRKYEDRELKIKVLRLQEKKTEEIEKEASRLWELVAQKRAREIKLREEIAERKKKTAQNLKKAEALTDNSDPLMKMIHQLEDVQEFVNDIQSRLNMFDELLLKERAKQKQMEEKRLELQQMEEEHEMTKLQHNLLLHQLKTEHWKSEKEAAIWQQKLDKVLQGATEKTLKIGNIKMAILNLFEMTGGVVGEDGVDIEDTDTQLDKILSCFKEQEDILRRYSRYSATKATTKEALL